MISAPNRPRRLVATYPFQVIINPFEWRSNPVASTKPFPVPQITFAHGDLNPRNLHSDWCWKLDICLDLSSGTKGLATMDLDRTPAGRSYR